MGEPLVRGLEVSRPVKVGRGDESRVPVILLANPRTRWFSVVHAQESATAWEAQARTVRLDGWISRLLGIDDGQPFQDRDVAEPLVGRDEVIDGCHLINTESHGQLESVQSAAADGLSRVPWPMRSPAS